MDVVVFGVVVLIVVGFFLFKLVKFVKVGV